MSGVAKAIAWYRDNRERVAAVLPLTVPGVTYQPRSLAALDKWIAEAERGDLSPLMTEAYVLRPIRHFYRRLEKTPSHRGKERLQK